MLSSKIITRGIKMKKLENVHPGEILLEEFLLPLGISQNKLARDIYQRNFKRLVFISEPAIHGLGTSFLRVVTFFHEYKPFEVKWVY